MPPSVGRSPRPSRPRFSACPLRFAILASLAPTARHAGHGHPLTDPTTGRCPPLFPGGWGNGTHPLFWVTWRPVGGRREGRSSPGRHRRRCRSRNSNSARFMTPLVPGCVGFRFRPGPTQSDHAFAGDRQRALRRVRALSASANPDGKPLLIKPLKRALPQSLTILVNTHATPRTATITPACARPYRNMCTLFSYPRQDPSFSGMCSQLGAVNLRPASLDAPARPLE